jgi:hypothetical protein
LTVPEGNDKWRGGAHTEGQSGFDPDVGVLFFRMIEPKEKVLAEPRIFVDNRRVADKDRLMRLCNPVADSEKPHDAD